jgi:hypothetical protein
VNRKLSYIAIATSRLLYVACCHIDLFVIVHNRYRCLKVERNNQARGFTFDAVFNEESNQDEVFHYSGIKHLVDMAIDG